MTTLSILKKIVVIPIDVRALSIKKKVLNQKVTVQEVTSELHF